jgi:cell wall-associated NlpC family hydrolase
LMAIAQRAGISVETLLWANQIDDPDTLTVGMELVVLPVSGVLYSVEPGDTLNALSAQFNVSVDELLMANGIDDPATIQIGTKLLMPGGSPIRPTATPAPTPTPIPIPTSTPTPKPQPTPEAPVAAAAQPVDSEPVAAAEEPAAAEMEVASEPAPAPSLGQQTIAIAQEFVGYNYVWGGISPSPGFDCTGYVYYIFNKRLGIRMPRDLWGQLGSGTRVSRGQVQAGDLVFFQNTYQSGLSHVGIALDNERFIHASSERYGVMVSRLGDAYWSARWYGATRP